MISNEGLIEFIKILILTIIFDTLWFKFAFSNSFYSSINELLYNNPNKLIGIFVWFLMTTMQYLFVKPLANKHSNNIFNVPSSIIYGAIFGFCIFGIYNGTNLAFIKKWTLRASIIDTLWGTISQSLLAYIIH